jgi:hypothetical protein
MTLIDLSEELTPFEKVQVTCVLGNKKGLLLSKAELTTLVQKVQRLWDLCRYARETLLEDGLLSNDEYAALAEDYPAVDRLDTMDELRAEIRKVKAEVPCHPKKNSPKPQDVERADTERYSPVPGHSRQSNRRHR